MNKKLLSVAVLSTLVSSSLAYALDRSSEEEIGHMHWTKASGMQFPMSRSQITKMENFAGVKGNEAARFRELADGASIENVDADVVNPETGAEVVFQWLPLSYVSSDDWSDIDPDSFLEQIKRNSEQSNLQRRVRGLPTLTTTGWQKVPTLNRDTHTVS